MAPSPIVARLKRPAPLFVCSKCTKRVKGGKDMLRALRAATKDHAQSKGRKCRKLKRVSCFGLCPKRGVVVCSPASLTDGRVTIISPDADAAEVLSSLLEETG